MELLGSSLESLFQTQNRKFSLKTTCMLGIQMIDRIEYIHSRKLIHRDIKPDNFAIGRDNNSHILYILDFGLTKKFWSSTHKCHIPYIEGKKLTGTARYASINALGGCEQSRRDDLESIFYILIYFLKGKLPWQGLKLNKKEDRNKKIYEMKKNIIIRELCTGLPDELELFHNYIRNLEFEQVPDYYYLKMLLKNILEKNNFSLDFCYDWNRDGPYIDKDNIIYKNNYNINYNGKEEWLIRKEASYLKHDINENKNIYNNNNDDYAMKNNNKMNKIYFKPVLPLKHQIFKSNKSKSNLFFNNKNKPPRTAENSYYES